MLKLYCSLGQIFSFILWQRFTDTIEPPIEIGPFYWAPIYWWPIIGRSVLQRCISAGAKFHPIAASETLTKRRRRRIGAGSLQPNGNVNGANGLPPLSPLTLPLSLHLQTWKSNHKRDVNATWHIKMWTYLCFAETSTAILPWQLGCLYRMVAWQIELSLSRFVWFPD